MSQRFYITTPIYYINAEPHIGHAYTTIAADVLARFERLRGKEVLFATGTDEHGQKMETTAREHGLEPQEFADRMVGPWYDIWEELNISYDVFIRTTEPRHERATQHLFQRLLRSGDIYKGVYEGWYCMFCETYFPPAEAADGLCPNAYCRRPLQHLQEPAYFFRTSKYADALLEHIAAHPEWIQPEERRNEVVRFIEGGLKDACISRSRIRWGIPVPDDPEHVIYVWFDALINYLTVAGYPEGEEFSSIWPPDVQLMAKDILTRFHATLWPAMLLAAGLPLPRLLFGHGFWTVEGRKMSKSLGNVIHPGRFAEEIARQSGASKAIAVDAVRYFLMREVPFGADGDFSREAFVLRFDADLANDLGNLLNRSLSMLQRYRSGTIPHPNGSRPSLREATVRALEEAEKAFEELRFSDALQALWQLVNEGNKYIDSQAPWSLHREGRREELDDVLYNVLETLRALAIALSPVMPTAAEEIWRQLGLGNFERQRWAHAKEWGRLPPGGYTERPRPIFPRIRQKGEGPPSLTTPAKESAAMAETKPVITYEEFQRLDLRIAEVMAAERVPNTEKLLKLTVNDGQGQRVIVAGIATHYRPEELVGRKIVLLANLQPARIRGIESQGMLLAAGEGAIISLLQPDQDVPPGTVVR